MKMVILGGTGFVGKHLVAHWRARGADVVVASRDPLRARESLAPGVTSCGVSPAEIAEHAGGADAVVNLAGASIFGRRWTAAYKRKILRSRVETTTFLAQTIADMPAERRPRALLNASAVGFYGDRGEDELTEDEPPGSDFLATTCMAWEAVAAKAADAGVRVTTCRFGIVLGPDGGALAPMTLQFRAFAGGSVGTGRQWVSWIHLNDLAGLMDHCLDKAVTGPVNFTTPQPVRMDELCRALGRALHRPCWTRMPAPVLRLVAGEVADTMTGSVRALPLRAQEAGYAFHHPAAGEALEAVVRSA